MEYISEFLGSMLFILAICIYFLIRGIIGIKKKEFLLFLTPARIKLLKDRPAKIISYLHLALGILFTILAAGAFIALYFNNP